MIFEYLMAIMRNQTKYWAWLICLLVSVYETNKMKIIIIIIIKIYGTKDLSG